MSAIFIPRTTDELHLAWLRARCRGLKSAVIASNFGVKPETVRIVTTRIRNEDMNLSGERPQLVLKEYWE